ncbi:MAG: hypothetical protein AAF604_10730 [Acidobacteriota bacterium]
MAKAKSQLSSVLKKQNDALRSDLQEAHDKIIEICDSTNKQLLPSLDEQVKAAATLTFDTSQDLAEIEARMIQRLLDRIHRRINTTYSEVEDHFTNAFQDQVDRTSDHYIQRLEKHIERYRDTFEKLSDLRRTALAKESQLGEAVPSSHSA